MIKKPVLAILLMLLMLTTMISPGTIIPITPVKAWTYNDEAPSDTKFEKFGPRADKLLIKLYSTAEAEWDALAKGEIDITDWPLTKLYYDLFTSTAINPATGMHYNDTINTIFYGDEFRLFTLDINNNNEQYLGNPPNPLYPNSVYPNPTSVKELRQAIAYLADRGQLETLIGAGFYSPIYTLVLPSMGAYSHPEIKPGGALESLTYPYSRASAEAKLNAGGFPIGADGWRYWDRNSNGIKDADEDLNLKFFIRSDHTHHRDMGNFMVNELTAVKVKVTPIYGGMDAARLQVMNNKDFHIYTGDWPLDVDPDYLINWNSEYYWHPGIPNNYAGVNNPHFNTYSYGVGHANTFEEATINAWQAQEVFAQNALSIPLWSYAGSKAMSRLYTGGNMWTPVAPDDGENAYRGQYWEGSVSVGGYGVDSGWSFMNMHPRGYERGDGNMTIRYGCHVSQITSLNPLYASVQNQGESPEPFVIRALYDTMLNRNPYNLGEFMPWLAENYTVGTYAHPICGTCSKVKFTLRPDVTWSDGTPLTTADVYFTLVELDDILRTRGFPPPSWKSKVMDILDFRIIDPYNFDVLFSNTSIWALSWVARQRILPMHIWKPICESGDPTDFAPDPNMIGSGSWRFGTCEEFSHLLMYANKPCSTVKTDLPGSIPITSQNGYFRYLDFEVSSYVRDPQELAYSAKLPPIKGYYTMPFMFTNKYLGGPITMNATLEVYNATTRALQAVFTNETGAVNAGESVKFADTSSSWGCRWGFLKTVQRVSDTGPPWRREAIYRFTYVYYIIVYTAMTLITHTTWFRPCTVIETRILIPIEISVVRWTLIVKLPYRAWPLGRTVFTGDPELWMTIKEDIVGSTFYDDVNFSTYPYKSDLPSPDFKVDIKDVATAAKAFGTYPGHPRWSTVADINSDYKIDIKDIAAIAKKFGWTKAP